MKKLPLLLVCLAPVAEAADFAGLSLQQALEQLRAQGLDLFYSSDLVRPGMRVEIEPVATEPRAILDEILAPHGLSTAPAPGGGLLLVRRQAAQAATAQAASAAASIALGEVIVSASHYQFGIEPVLPSMVLSAGDLELMPDMGDDPIRAVARLPGVARADFSSRMHLRGGTAEETLVLFDDLRLYNPFHFKDFLGIFSTIDPGIVGDVTVYTGGFPASYGDRSSGVIAFRPAPPEDDLFGQVLVSVFSVGVAGGGRFDSGEGDWRLSARRGNMDWILDATAEELGKPKYHDLHGSIRHNLGDRASISANALVFVDEITAFDSDQEEGARASYRDEYYWLRLDLGEEDRLGARLLAAETRLRSDRSGVMDLPGVASGSLDDLRRFRIHSLQADGWWRAATRVLLQGGLEWRDLSGHYLYRDDAEFDLLFLTPGAPTETTRTRAIEVHPSGQQHGVYANVRLEPDPAFTVDLGLRWDRETLTPEEHSDWSPRAAFLWEPRDGSRFRLSWGRFSQAQGVNELPVPDGQTAYARPQDSTHLVASYEQRLGSSLELRLEAYRKKYENVQPRFENLLNTLIVLPELKPDRIRIAPQRATAEGIETGLHWRDDPWSGWLSYSASRVEDRVDGVDLQRSWDQRHYVSGGLGYHGGLWEFSLAGTWYSGWPTTAVALETLDPEALVTTGVRNAERLGDYLRIDGRIARRFDYDGGSNLTVFLELNNILSRGNDCCVEYQLEDEEIPGVVFLDLQTLESLPLVPSLGVIWRF